MDNEKQLERYFRIGLFIITMFLALIATFQFYFSVQEMIGTWFEYQYVPIFRAVFSFFVLCVCIYLTRFYIISRR
ncbi:hypothetical protein CW696_05970 [ANME-2 cluster archaeon]|nr:hypothetical protein [candidate division Zixibacteria bacterium]RJS70336.1 MAG: hypothetical protein CW696_05970 [ANME-2 cluster archaeon]